MVPGKELIGYGKQLIDEQDIQNVVDVLRSDFLTDGPKVKEFEAALCEYTGAKYCVAVANGTAALHISILSLGIVPGMEAVTSPNTFVASSNAMIYSQLKPIFADIDPNSFCMDHNEIVKHTNQNTKLYVPVHFAGRAMDMKKLSDFAKSKNIYIVEDAAHALGSEYPSGGKVGNCQHSDMTIFSFHPVKTIITGEGGAVTTNNKDLYKKLLSLRSHGITKNPENMAKNAMENNGRWYYEMQELGFNYRLTDFQAALGISQLNKLDNFIKRRSEIIKKYDEAFKDIDLITIPLHTEVTTSYHLYVLCIDFEKLGKNRDEVMGELRQNRIGTQVHYIPVHLQPFYQKNYKYSKGDFPMVEKYYQKALSIPLYPKMTDSEVNHVIDQIKKIF